MLTVIQLAKNVSAFCEKRRFITVFTEACHWSPTGLVGLLKFPSLVTHARRNSV